MTSLEGGLNDDVASTRNPETGPSAVDRSIGNEIPRGEIASGDENLCYLYCGDMDGAHAYLVTSWLNNRARCQCGYEGKRRWFRGNAVIDVVEHCQATKHKPVGLPAVKQMQAL